MNFAPIIISLDAMGGDKAPESVIKGALLQAIIHPEVKFLFFGNEPIISQLISKNLNLAPNLNYEIIHCEKVISSDEKPTVALRQGKNSSMWMAVESIANKQAHAVVSSGNTGALMAISKIILRLLAEIHRPAIAGIVPTIHGKLAMLDLGANAECSAENLFEFAVMGDAFAKVVLDIEKPKIGILNIGSEEIKGNDITRLAANLIRESDLDLNFIGFVEGNDIAEGTADVVVADGFSGNIALKTAEGTAKFCKHVIANAFKSTFMAKIGYLLAKKAIDFSAKKLDARLYNGAMLLGLNGIVVKSHGASDHIGVSTAINTAIELAKNNINEKIAAKMDKFNQSQNNNSDDLS